jgi:hypothetical protein
LMYMWVWVLMSVWELGNECKGECIMCDTHRGEE